MRLQLSGPSVRAASVALRKNIYEIEVLSVLLATKLWMPFLTGCPTVFFLDNVAARASFKGCAASFIKEFVQLEARLKNYPRFGRVPSHSNISDLPSRLSFSDPTLAGCERVRIVVVALMAQLVWRHSCVADRLPVVVRIPAGP